MCGWYIVTRCIRFVYPPLLQGVIEFAAALFFSKLVSYAFLFWLPFYIKNTSELPQIIWSCMCIHLHTRIMFFFITITHFCSSFPFHRNWSTLSEHIPVRGTGHNVWCWSNDWLVKISVYMHTWLCDQQSLWNVHINICQLCE